MIISDEKLEEMRKEGTEFLDRLKDRVHEQEWEIKHLEDLYNQALKDYDKSLEEIEQLQLELDNEKSNSTKAYKRIVKAIDFLKENACIDEDVDYFCDDLRYDDCKKLLEILKGSDKEWKYIVQKN